MSGHDDVHVTDADIAAHAEEMRHQAWWPLFEAEQRLAPCPSCGARRLLLVDGTGVCEDGCP